MVRGCKWMRDIRPAEENADTCVLACRLKQEARPSRVWQRDVKHLYRLRLGAWVTGRNGVKSDSEPAMRPRNSRQLSPRPMRAEKSCLQLHARTRMFGASVNHHLKVLVQSRAFVGAYELDHCC